MTISQPQETNWLPIETAPKQGSLVWISNKRNMRIAFWRDGKEFECQGSIGGGWRDAETGRDIHFSPSHWRNLPELPQ